MRYPHRLALVLLLSLSAAAGAPSPPPAYPPPPSAPSSLAVLQAFRDRTQSSGGDPYDWLLTWTGSSYCSWAGVTCTGVDVTALDLSFGSISGTLPDEFQYLTLLSVLNLQNNAFYGTLPSSWSSWGGSISEVDLGNNLITGTLPASWSAWSSVTKVQLVSNVLVSTIPQQWGSGTPSMSSIFRVSLDSNTGMCGSLPSNWGGKVTYANTRVTLSCPGPPPPPPGSSYSLLVLKAAITSDPSNMTGSWAASSAASQCSWGGVGCNGLGAVTLLDLSYGNVQVRTPLLWCCCWSCSCCC